MKTLYLVRHAKSAPHPELANGTWPLSPQGQAQAEALAVILASLGIEALFSSTFLRAQKTLEPFARRAGLPVMAVEGLHERELTKSFTDDFDALVKRAWSDFDFALPGCETSREAQRRMGDALQGLARRTEAGVVAVASHGNAIGLFLNSLNPAFGHEQWKRMRMPDVFRIEIVGDAMRWDESFRFEGV